MVCYKITITRSAQTALKHLPEDIRKAISIKLDAMTKEPMPQGTKKLHGLAFAVYRIKVKKNYRIIYTIGFKNKVVDVLNIGHRSEIYRSIIRETANCH
ncbi:MAG: type II toxin-antitoxin system RelE/ParE family toxin [Deltaproteobacteria bacterium]|nr:type II toxin-antitoxin system RelE/ParE family toxin [Deltaproteobacteria bacterium]